MLDAILNNPQYIMLGMIGVFIAVVIVMIFLAMSGGRFPSTQTRNARPRSHRDDHGEADGDGGGGDSGGGDGGGGGE